MTTLLSLDGGNRKTNGRASYRATYMGGEIIEVCECTLADAQRLARGEGYVPGAVAVERPDYLKAGVPPKVIFGLSWNVCRIAYTLAQGAPVYEYTVNDGAETDWIGTTSKPVLHQRIWAALTARERACFPEQTHAEIDRASEHYARKRKILEHIAFNILDAAGVGLFHLGRIKKGGAKP